MVLSSIQIVMNGDENLKAKSVTDIVERLKIDSKMINRMWNIILKMLKRKTFYPPNIQYFVFCFIYFAQTVYFGKMFRNKPFFVVCQRCQPKITVWSLWCSCMICCSYNSAETNEKSFLIFIPNE